MIVVIIIGTHVGSVLMSHLSNEEKFEEWQNNIELIIGPFDRYLSKLDYFVNDTIFVSYILSINMCC